MSARYFDDFKVGERFTTRAVTFTESAIVDFAFRYDPQPFHIDKHAAEHSHYGGLIASGFQTLAQTFRLFLAEGVLADCSMGSPAMDELRWLIPVRPDDTLHIEAEVKETRASRSKPDRGILRMFYAVKNQHDDTVMSYFVTHLLKRRVAED